MLAKVSLNVMILYGNYSAIAGKAEVVALHDVILRGKADGKSLLQTNVVRCLVFGEFEGDVLRAALATPSCHHHVRILVFIPCGNHDGGQGCDDSLVAEVLAPLNGLYLHLFLHGILVHVCFTLLLLVSTGGNEQCACQHEG